MAGTAPGAPTGPPPAAMVALVRNPDGRHAVTDAAGNILGLHNSLASAQRHMGDYYEPQGSAGIPQNTFQPPAIGPNTQIHGTAYQQPGGGFDTRPVAVQEAQAQEQALARPPSMATNPGSAFNAYQQAATQVHPAVGLGGPGPASHADLVAGMNYGHAVMTGAAPPPPGYAVHGGQLVHTGPVGAPPGQMKAQAVAQMQERMQNQQDAQRRLAMQQAAQQRMASGGR